MHFPKEDIYKIIKNLDPNKAHGHDMISIRMIKLCGISICKPLEIIFQNCLRSGKFPSEWKKANVVPTFKKGDKQCIKNYCPVSLLPVCGKVFERLLMFNNRTVNVPTIHTHLVMIFDSKLSFDEHLKSVLKKK